VVESAKLCEVIRWDYDIILAGLGAMGSATAYHLSRQGSRVLGLDRFHPPHTHGSSHGLTRIIREAYFEHPLYVPLVQRAYALWQDLEKDSGRRLLRRTGGLMIGPPAGLLVTGARRSAQEHGLAHRMLSAAELRTEFPAFVAKDDTVAVWEPRAGIVFPELAIQTHLELAAKNGADLRFNEPMGRWEALDGGVRVFVASGSFTAQRLLLSAGAWMSELLPNLNLPLAVERQVLFWFEPVEPGIFSPERCPVFIWENAPHTYFYGFPDLGEGVKIGIHHQGTITSADELNRNVSTHEEDRARHLMREFLPDAAGPIRSSVVCMYTNTPDEHFILDFHPGHPQVLIASPCSGHGFKFSPVIGEIASALLHDEPPGFDLAPFRLKRFGNAAHQ
jgi:sarcosine oxidase